MPQKQVWIEADQPSVGEQTYATPDDTAWLNDLPKSVAHGSALRKFLIIGAMALAAIISSIVAWRILAKPAASAYAVAEVRRGDLAKTISATGKLQAVTTVQVGSQISGMIAELYADFNNQVRKGQIIARLDPSQLEAQLTQARANLQGAQARIQNAEMAVLSAQASVDAAQANVDRTEAVVQDAQRNHNLIQEMIAAGVRARRDIETAQATLAQAHAQKQQAIAQVNQAKAQAAAAKSQLEQARAEHRQAQAQVEIAGVNLERTVIRAPIDGIVIARNVDVGQTVAASLQAPTLFLIANDLTRMQVLADIDEADVGQLKTDSRVTFTVDAFPSDTFTGRISQVRMAPQTVQNVVTYTAVIDVGNPDLKLRPGMTATITAVVDERKDVLRVPNSALRFRPESVQGSGSAERPNRPAPQADRPRRGSMVWTIEADKLQPARIETGMTDGISTEVTSGLQEGMKVAVPAQTGAGANRPANSMFPMGPRGTGGRRR